MKSAMWRKFLRSVLESEQVEACRKKIVCEEILTGKARSQVLAMKKTGQLK